MSGFTCEYMDRIHEHARINGLRLPLHFARLLECIFEEIEEGVENSENGFPQPLGATCLLSPSTLPTTGTSNPVPPQNTIHPLTSSSKNL